MAFTLGIAALALFVLAGSLIGWRQHLRAKRRKMEKDIEEAREALRELKQLIETPGWKRIGAIAQVQIEGRRNEVLLQPTTDPYEQEYKKGELHGIQLFLEFPKQLIEMNKAVIDMAIKLERDGE